uniref:Uncharacterized protein n=1 Tax=viral metagenome TaxID=1070528 RepID=A0A6C0JVU8_9ZZZZ
MDTPFPDETTMVVDDTLTDITVTPTDQQQVETIPVKITYEDYGSKDTYFERLIIRVLVETCNLGDELNNVTTREDYHKTTMLGDSFDYFYDTFYREIFEAFEIKNMTGCEISHIKEVIQAAISDIQEYGPSTVFFNMKHDPEVEHIAFMYILSTITGSIQKYREMQEIINKSVINDNVCIFNIDDVGMVDQIVKEIDKSGSRIKSFQWYVFSGLQNNHAVYNKKEGVLVYNIQDPHTFIGNGIREGRFYQAATLTSIGLLGLVGYFLYKRYN